MAADLLQRSRSLKTRAEAASSGIRAQDEVARYHEAARVFNASITDIAAVVTRANALRVIGVTPTDIAASVQRIQQLRATLASDLASDDVRIQVIARDTQRTITEVVSELKQVLNRGLEDWSAAHPQPDEGLLEVTAEVAPRETQRTRKAMQNFAVALGRTAHDMTKIPMLADAAEELDNAYDAMTEALPADVRDFVREVARPGGASLRALPPTVLVWLRERDVDRSFVVRLKPK